MRIAIPERPKDMDLYKGSFIIAFCLWQIASILTDGPRKISPLLSLISTIILGFATIEGCKKVWQWQDSLYQFINTQVTPAEFTQITTSFKRSRSQFFIKTGLSLGVVYLITQPLLIIDVALSSTESHQFEKLGAGFFFHILITIGYALFFVATHETESLADTAFAAAAARQDREIQTQQGRVARLILMPPPAHHRPTNSHTSTVNCLPPAGRPS